MYAPPRNPAKITIIVTIHPLDPEGTLFEPDSLSAWILFSIARIYLAPLCVLFSNICIGQEDGRH